VFGGWTGTEGLVVLLEEVDPFTLFGNTSLSKDTFQKIYLDQMQRQTGINVEDLY
jgi:hypothetical protein